MPDLSEDDIRLLDRVSDWIMAADEKYITKFSAFLDERQCLLCEKLMASVKYENYRLWGGYENAARRMLCVYPEYGEAESEDFPITAITLLYRKEDKITHRDILGSLMGLRIKETALATFLWERKVGGVPAFFCGRRGYKRPDKGRQSRSEAPGGL